MKNLILLNRSGMSPDGMSRKGRYCLDPILSRLCLASLICLCMLTVGSGNAWAVEYTYTDFTIKFTKGTTNGTNISSNITSGSTNVSTIASEGSGNYAAKVTSSSASYYSATGCALRLSSSSNTGSIKFTLNDALKDSTIYAIVVYASKISGNTKANLKVTPAGGYTTATTYANASLPTYNTSYPSTTHLSNYKLDTIKVGGKKLTTLQFECTSSKGYTMLHAVTVVTQTEKAAACANSVGVTKGSESHGAVTTISSASVATCSGTASDRRVTITVTPDDCYDAPSTLTWTKSSGTVSASKQSGPTDNGDGTYSYVYQFAQNDNGAGTFGVTCTAKAAGNTVNFDAGPGVSAASSLTETCSGSGVTLPNVTATGVCKGWTTFAGWATAAVNDSNTTSVTVYAAGSKYVPASNNMTLYAVYSKVKGGGSGFKLSLNSGGTDYYVGAKGSGSYMSAVTDAADAVVFTFANGYLSYDNSGTKTYISSEGNNTTLTVGTSVPSSTWTESGTTTYTYQSSATGNRYLGFNSGTSPVRFAPYGSSYAHAFTKHSLSTTYYCSDPNCCTQLGSINGSFSFTSVGTTGATANWGWTGATTGISKNILKVYKESDNSLVATIDNISASATSQAITGLDPCTEYYVKLSTVSSGGGYCDGVADQTGASHVTFTTSSYTVTKTGVTNVTAASLSAIPATTCASGFGPITIEAASGYVLPATVTVTGATGSWTQATGSLTISSVTGNVSITITPTAASCASFSFHTGTGDDATVKTTNTTTCFSQVNSSTTWKIDNYVIPADTKFFVGDRGFFYDDNLGSNNSRSAVKTWSQEMFFEYTKVYGDGYRPTVGQATGAIGTLYIWSDNNWNNLHVGFSPQGYVFKLGSANLAMSGSATLDADRYWETSVITLTSTDISGNYQTNLYTGSAGGVASNNTQSTAVNTMGVKTNAGDNWRGTAINVGTDANTRGFFRIDIGDGGTKNWHAHWVPTHRVIFHSNYPGGGGPADTYSVDVSVEETNNSIALASAPSAPTGYTFAGWYDVADGGNHITTARTISAGASANVELWAHWTANTISLTLDKNTEDAGSNNGSGSIDFDATSGTISTAPTRTGYTVEGYYTDAACTAANKVLTNIGAVVNSTVSGYTTSGKWTRATTPTTLYTKWTPNNYTVTWHVGDATSTSTVAYNTEFQDISVGKPSVNNNSLSACESNYFVGWVTSGGIRTTDGGTVALYNSNKVNATDKITGDIDFYAMFATSSGSGSPSYKKVTSTSNITNDGRYLIVEETDGVVFNGGLSTIDATNNVIAATFTAGVLAITDGNRDNLAAAEFSIDMTNLYVKNKDNKYIYQDSYGNGLPNTTTPTALHSISIDGDEDFIVEGNGQNSNSPYDYAVLRFNNNTGSGNWRFRFYKGTQQKIQLYKYDPGTTYSNYRTNCAACANTVTVSYNAAPTGGTVAVEKGGIAIANNGTVKTCDGSVNLTVTITPASHYTVTGLTAQISSTDMSQSNVGNVYTVTIPQNQTGTLTLTPTFTPETPLTITLNTNSKGTFTPIGTIYSGDSFTFPTVTPSDAECSSFLGWIEGTTWSGDGTETDPTAITGLANYHAAGSSSGTLTTTKTYTAVFGEKDTQVIPAYQKVTSAPSNWSGDYLIVRDANSRAFDGSLSTLDADNNYISVTISAGSITANSTVNASKWTIAKVGETSNYTIKSASGYYIGRTASSNGLNSSTSEAYTNTLSYSDGHVVITSSGGPTLQMNSGTRFRYYTTSQQALQLYKYNPDAEVVSYTYCTNPACTPRYRVTISSATGGSPEADKTYEHADETITITANPAAGYSFTSWTITKTTGGDNVTSTLLTGDKPTTANTTFTMPAYDITIAATYTKKMVSTLEVKDGATVVSTTTGPVSGTVNISTGANKTLDVVITPSDAYDHSWTATVSAGSTYASITNVTDDGFRVNGLAQGDATITVNAPNDGAAKSVTLTVQVRDIMPEEIILKRDGSNTPIETLIMYYDETNSKGQYVKVNVGYSPANPTNKAFTFSSALTGKVGSHSHAPASGYEVLVANGVTSDAVNCTFTSSADGSVTKVLAVTVLPILSDRFVDYVHGNATQTVSARLSDDRYSIIPDINTPSLSDASDANPTSEDCETSHYHLVGWLPQTTAEALWAAGTPITDATEGLVRAGESVEATGQTWCAIWAEEQ